MCPCSNHSQFTFENWGSAADQMIVENELGIQKRKPGNPDLLDTESQVDAVATKEAPMKPSVAVQCETWTGYPHSQGWGHDP